MKKTLFIVFLGFLFSACEKDNCYLCDSCNHQFAHLMNNRTYCVDGFDNRKDFEEFIDTQREHCTCVSVEE